MKLDSDRDYYMSAAEAKDYGLVDEVVKSRKEAKLLDGARSPEALDRDRGGGLAPQSRGIRSCFLNP